MFGKWITKCRGSVLRERLLIDFNCNDLLPPESSQTFRSSIYFSRRVTESLSANELDPAPRSSAPFS